MRASLAVLLGLLWGLWIGPMTAVAPADETSPTPARRQLFRGQVVRLGEALQRKGVSFSGEVAEHLVLQTPQGELIPILADWRGRAFYQDERLRERTVELVGFRRDDLPYLQIVMIYVIDPEGRRLFMDYWCDICAIAMYEIKPCECCQGPSRLRLEPKELPSDIQRQLKE